MGADSFFAGSVDRIGGEPISARMAQKAPIRHLDPSLLLVTVLLATFGAVMVFSATAGSLQDIGADPNTFLRRQIIFSVIGAVVLLGLSLFDYRHLRTFAPLIYGGAILALIVVLTPLGEVQVGARRWINFGAFQAQPSELAKLAAIITIATVIAVRDAQLRARDIAMICGLLAVPGALIYLEPDLGTMLVFVFLAAALLIVGGAKLRHLLALGLVALTVTFGIIQLGLLKDYQIQRITAFLDPNPDVQSEGYNLAQSMIAIGSGGIRGKGLQDTTSQTSLDYVPEQHTDFIFTAVGEQLGFIGSAALLALFAFLIWRALRIAALSRDLFGTLLATGIAALWAFQVFVNVGMTMGIMPITGIPLPFLSYGGSSLLTNFAAVGILLNIHMRRFL